MMAEIFNGIFSANAEISAKFHHIYIYIYIYPKLDSLTILCEKISMKIV